MLPSNLLRVKLSKGKVSPVFATLDQTSMALAEQMIEVYQASVGEKQGSLMQRMKSLEEGALDYKLVRGLAALLDRRCVFEIESQVDPKMARQVVFEEASKRRAVSVEERKKVIEDVSLRLNTSPETLEKSLWSDIEEELVLRKFQPIDPPSLIKRYNLSLAQTLLFKCMRMEFTSSGNWKNIFRAIKWLGLMYSVEQNATNYIVSVDGPLSIFKMTDRYGTSVAKLLPEIMRSESWRVKADILSKRKDRIYNFEVSSIDVKPIMESIDLETSYANLYDSSIEERFARSFNSYNTGWVLRREPEPLIAGKHVLIPDFGLERDSTKVYLEIVGFWTQEYLERKIGKLNALSGVDMIVAVNESLACSKLQKLSGKVIYYTKYVPMKPILDHLRKYEEAITQAQVHALRKKGISLTGDVVGIEDLARAYGVSAGSVEVVLQEIDANRYRRVGQYYVSVELLQSLKEKIETLGEPTLSTAAEVIESHGLRNPTDVLKALGYTIVWSGLDYERTRVKKILT